MTSPLSRLQFLPEQILKFDSLSSTNDYLKEAAGKGNLPEGTVVWAMVQTKGKGQHNNIWLSEPGQNLTLSILLKPQNLLAAEAFQLSKSITLAVYNTISHFVSGNIGIKWPNDLFIDQRKISGILIENSIVGDKVKQCIVGIGVNVNQTIFHSENNPTSLANHKRERFVLEEVANVLLNNISDEYLRLQLNAYKNIDEEYFLKLYDVKNEQTFLIHGESKKCIIEGINPDGSIVINSNGSKQDYLHGDALWKI